jgi:hypothetical protein
MTGAIWLRVEGAGGALTLQGTLPTVGCLGHYGEGGGMSESQKPSWRDRLRDGRARRKQKAAERGARRARERSPMDRNDDYKYGQLGGTGGDWKQGGRR